METWQKAILVIFLSAMAFLGISLLRPQPLIWETGAPGSSSCYQETANVSTLCGGLANGSYVCDANWDNDDGLGCGFVYDGNWSSHGRADSGKEAYMYVNYSKPVGAINTSVWKVNAGSNESLTIDAGCWELDPLQFMVYSDYTGAGDVVEWKCKNSTGSWKMIGNEMATPDAYEEGILWNIFIGTSNVTCGDALNESNVVYTLNASQSSVGTCFNVSAQNITINCNGYALTGDNTSNSYGVYSNQFNTTIKNCSFSNFSTGIYFNGATNGTINYTNVSTSYPQTGSRGFGIEFENTNDTVIFQSVAIATGGSGVGIYLGSSANNTILYSVGNATNYGTYFGALSNHNFIANCNMSGIFGLYLTTSSNSTISDSIFTGSNIGISIDTNSNYTNITRTTSTGGTTGNSIYIVSSYNTVSNTTLIHPTGTLLYLSANASNNNFYWNNFTNTSGLYVNDTNGSNYYNTTITGTTATNGSVVYTPLNPSMENPGTGGAVNPANWTYSGGIGGRTNLSAHTGNWSNKILQTGNAATISSQNLTNLNLTNNTNYTAIVWLYINSSQAQFANLTGMLSMGSGVSSTATRYKYGLVETHPAGDTWTQVNLTFTYNSSTDLYFCLYVNGSNASGDGFVYWDDVAIENVSISAIASSSEGNIWYNVVNGSANIWGINRSTFNSNFFIGTSAHYNDSTSQGKTSGLTGSDEAPLTLNNSSSSIWASDGENFTIAFVIPQNGTLVYSLNFENASCSISTPTTATIGTPTMSARLAPNGLVYNQIGSSDYFEETVKNYFGSIPGLPDIRNRTYGIDFMTNCTGFWQFNNVTNITSWNGTNCAGATVQFTVNTTTKMKALQASWNKTVCANSLELTYAGIYGGYIGKINISAT